MPIEVHDPRGEGLLAPNAEPERIVTGCRGARRVTGRCGGRVWTSAWDGVRCHAPDGDLLLKILLPEFTSNLVIDTRGPRRMFITAPSSVWRIALGAA